MGPLHPTYVMLKDRPAPLPKDHPQRVANRARNEQQHKRKVDEVEKKRKHDHHEAKLASGKYTDATEEDDDEDVREIGNIPSSPSIPEERSSCLLIHSFFLDRGPLRLFLWGRFAFLITGCGVSGMSRGSEPRAQT